MSDKRRCKTCSAVMYRDEPCPSCSGDYEKRVRVLEAEGLTRSDAQGVVDMEGPLPAYDPQVQEDRDFWARRIGRDAANELNPECDPLDGERR